MSSASIHIPECLSIMDSIEKNLSDLKDKNLETSTTAQLGTMYEKLINNEGEIDKIIMVISLISLKNLKNDQELKKTLKQSLKRTEHIKEKIELYKNLVTTHLLKSIAPNDGSQFTDPSLTSPESSSQSTPRKRSVTSEHIEI